jgi:hypothetical protein
VSTNLVQASRRQHFVGQFGRREPATAGLYDPSLLDLAERSSLAQSADSAAKQ